MMDGEELNIVAKLECKNLALKKIKEMYLEQIMTQNSELAELRTLTNPIQLKLKKWQKITDILFWFWCSLLLLIILIDVIIGIAKNA